MDAVRNLSQRDACFPDDMGAAAQGTTSYTVKKGDTLAKLAAALMQQGVKGSREEVLRQILTLNPQIKDQNQIAQGATLQLPVAQQASTGPAQPEQKTNLLEAFVSRFSTTLTSLAPRQAESGGAALTAGALACMGTPAMQAATFLRTNGVPFQTSPDGTPKYKQADYEAGGNWGARYLGESADTQRTIASRGCAMTSVAMALSKLSGETITPAVLDAFLDAKNGYLGNAIKWDTAGKVTESRIAVAKTTAWNLDTVNAELAAGRPVVLGVDYKAGKSGGNLGTDHWVCLTRRDPTEPNRYFANDPATGTEISFLKQPNGKLLEEQPPTHRKPYKSSGEFVTFKP
ncbi:MAG TPA: C39 family peptidase [Myxococcaceae bacterium]|jgi:hypothetical protein